jgi:hypothetical protein
MGAGPRKTTPPQVGHISVNPRSEAQLEADESVVSTTYHHVDREATVWDACDDDEDDEIRPNRIIWKQLNPAAD